MFENSEMKLRIVLRLTAVICAVGIIFSGGAAADSHQPDFLSDAQSNAIDSNDDGEVSLVEFRSLEQAYYSGAEEYGGVQFTLMDIVSLESYLVANNSPTDIQWTGSGTNGPVATQNVQVEPTAGSIEFGGSVGRSLVVENVDSGESVTITPQNQSYNVTEFEVNFNSLTSVTDGNRIKSDEPEISLIVTEEEEFVSFYPVEVSGDVASFYDNTFSEYKVELVDNAGNVIAATGDTRDSDGTRTLGAGYEWSYEYNGSALAITRNPSVQSDWYVELTQGDVTIPADNTGGSEYFIIDTTGTNFDKGENTDETFRFQIYPSEVDTSNDKTIINLFEPGGVEDQNIVEGPVGNQNQDPQQGNDDDNSRTIGLSGSTVTLSTGGVGAFGVDDLPSDVTVSEISDGGGSPPSNQDGIVWNSAAGLPETVSFTLTPDSSYTAGDTISFTADGTEITYTVVEISKPEELSDDVSSNQYAAFAGDDDEITQQDAVNGFNGWFNNGKYRGEELGQQEALELFNYWFDKGS